MTPTDQHAALLALAAKWREDGSPYLEDAARELEAVIATPPAADGGRVEAAAWRYRDVAQFGDHEWRYLDLPPLNRYAEVTPLYTNPSPSPVVDDAIASILHKLGDWDKAYPVDMFSEPTKAEREWLHKERRGLQDRIAADMGRHIAGLIRKDLETITAALNARDGGDAS